MSKTLKILVGVAILSVVSIGTAHAAMATGAHDMRAISAAQAGSDKGLCRFCHAPHNVRQAVAPLWDRTDSSAASFTPYTSTTMQGTASISAGSLSNGCLSCHDGVTAVDSLQNTSTLTGNTMTDLTLTNANALIGTDLSDDHPVGMAIDAGDAQIDSKANITAAGLETYGAGEGTVECASCHDVHGDAGFSPFLRLNPAVGALCEACHTK